MKGTEGGEARYRPFRGHTEEASEHARRQWRKGKRRRERDLTIEEEGRGGKERTGGGREKGFLLPFRASLEHKISKREKKKDHPITHEKGRKRKNRAQRPRAKGT